MSNHVENKVGKAYCNLSHGEVRRGVILLFCKRCRKTRRHTPLKHKNYTYWNGKAVLSHQYKCVCGLTVQFPKPLSERTSSLDSNNRGDMMWDERTF